MVGISSNSQRPSYFVAKYLQEKGYRVLPVNPTAKGEILGEKVWSSLEDVIRAGIKVDMVDIFRSSDAAGPIVDDIIRLNADLPEAQRIRVAWMQLTVRNDEAARRGKEAGLEVVMDRCPKIEFGRLSGELGWSGVDSRVISSSKVDKVRPGSKGEGTGGFGSTGEELHYGFFTRAVHAGARPDPTTGARVTPIYANTSYVFDSVDHAASLFNLHTFGYIYSRLTNPTLSVLESRLASLESGEAAVVAASGHAAQFLLFYTLMSGQGDHFLSSQFLYGGTITQFKHSFKKFGWNCTFFDPRKPIEELRALVDPVKTKVIFCESLANPGGRVTDLAKMSALAKEFGIVLVVDNTLASPYLCRPIEHGADIVVESTTKWLSGQGSAMGGVVVESGKFDFSGASFGHQETKYPSLVNQEPAYHGLRFYETFGTFALTSHIRAVALRDFGPTMSPQNAFLTIQGTETLPVRMERSCNTALEVAKYLEGHEDVAWVSYAGLDTSPDRELAKKYMRNGLAGGVFTFGLAGDSNEIAFRRGVKFVESLNLFSHLANVGDSRSLVLHPSSTTHRQLSAEQQIAAGAGPDVVRLSIGLEDAADLIRDLEQALDKASKV
ncbi:O-acetylhomoserine sulfhydrylase [Hyaloraphidium curvatum]|nr:O-acetylhomoserine sulfhydrylase [Hyaloraphidium curvatum]